MGATKGSVVALCLERSAALVVATLATLRTGAAYIPLDGTSPDQRITDLLDDSGASLFIAGADFASRLTEQSVEVLQLDLGQIRRLSAEGPSDEYAGLAYVCYTSGSTGRPKGVMVEHDSMRNLVDWHHQAFEINSTDRCTQIASPAFDAFAWEIWPCLAAGASLHIPPEELKTNPAGLRDWLVAEGITVTFLPTPLAEATLDLEWPATARLRCLLTGGDRLHRHPRPGLPFAVINNYGVTEATVVSTSAVVAPATGTAQPSIGRPIDGVEIRVVDDTLQPVADGERGELLIGGTSVARGYLGAPELTAERFVADSQTGTRWYRTGDRVRVREDGELDYLGRLDDQVQIRGQRVEPGEVAAALGSHSSVTQSVVVGREDGTGEQTLIAYLQGDGAQRPDVRELRAHVAERLPVHMLPTAFVWLDAMPLTPNGKIDRAALPPAPIDASGVGEPRRTPHGDLEIAVAAIIAELLKLESVGADEHFILLGGHSLMAAQLVVRLADRFGVEMQLRTVFEHPTVSEIAGEVLSLLVAEISSLTDVEASRLIGLPSGT
jgi:amino acid adenylation domain-containing protein